MSNQMTEEEAAQIEFERQQQSSEKMQALEMLIRSGVHSDSVQELCENTTVLWGYLFWENTQLVFDDDDDDGPTEEDIIQ